MTLRLPPDVVATDSADGLVLLDQRDGRYWHLNQTGAATIRLLLDGCSPEEAANLLAQRFPAVAEQVRSDVAALLGSLRRARLLVEAGP
jgi:hypothetical protein